MQIFKANKQVTMWTANVLRANPVAAKQLQCKTFKCLQFIIFTTQCLQHIKYFLVTKQQ